MAPSLHSPPVFAIATLFTVGLLLSLSSVAESVQYSAINCRKHTATITEFGGKGDGKTSNTKAFQAAVANLSKSAEDGGAQLVVPAGKWLTGSFNLTSHFTLFLEKDAVILASQVESEYPVFEPLPSYGPRTEGTDKSGKRYSSLIFGSNLTDVVITGVNGTLDGQGVSWWQKLKQKTLIYTRPVLIEVIYSKQVQISNITLLNSPSWNIHPVYSSDVIVQGVTILAPVDSPNTDGIDPDSCSNMLIQDCFIVSGDDCIAVKSGLDQYGIKVGIPTEHLHIRRLSCISPFSAVIALGSELSGGISDLRAEEIYALNSESAVRIKTAPGRGAFVKDIFVKGLHLKNMKYVFWMNGAYSSHSDDKFDPNAMTVVDSINYQDVVAENVTMTAQLQGLPGHPFSKICISNLKAELAPEPKKLQWNCTDVAGATSQVTPPACNLLPDKGAAAGCTFPVAKLPVDEVQLKACSF